MTDLVNNINKVVGQLLGVLNARSRDVVSRRFGLKNGEKETLDSIGKGYGVTRERVRQIEEVALKQMRGHLESGFSGTVAPYATLAYSILEEHGGTLHENELFEKFFGDIKNKKVANANLTFLLALNNQLHRFGETDNTHSFWTISPKHAQTSKNVIGSLVSIFQKHKNTVKHEELFNFYKKSASNSAVEPKAFAASLALSKDIGRNIFGEVGLVSWPRIKPRGVRDKAYLILKREGAPKHFTDITKLINLANFSTRKANIQTVHNELIKDDRFVLVGRGIYGLSEWGLKAGTVKDVLMDILRLARSPMPKVDLVSQVLNNRMVKENTILLNLQDSKVFKKTDDGLYTLREA